MKNLEVQEASKNKKQLEESTISDENENTDKKETASKVKNNKKVAAVIQEMEKIIRSKKSYILWLAYQRGKIFGKFKVNEKFINMVNIWCQQINNGFQDWYSQIHQQLSKTEKFVGFPSLFEETFQNSQTYL